MVLTAHSAVRRHETSSGRRWLIGAIVWGSAFSPHGAAEARMSTDSFITTAPAAEARDERLANDPRMIRWRQAFFLGAVLVLVFLIAAAAIIHFSMRYRTYLLRKPHAPTPSEDVWSMHKPPENYDLPDDERAD